MHGDVGCVVARGCNANQMTVGVGVRREGEMHDEKCVSEKNE